MNRAKKLARQYMNIKKEEADRRKMIQKLLYIKAEKEKKDDSGTDSVH